MINKVVFLLCTITTFASTSESLMIAFENYLGQSNQLLFLGSLEDNGFTSAVSNITFITNPSGYRDLNRAEDSVSLIKYLNLTKGTEWKSVEERNTVTSETPEIIVAGEFGDCIEAINYIELDKGVIGEGKEGYLFTDTVVFAEPVMKRLDSTYDMEGLTLLDLHTLSQVEEFEREYSKVSELEKSTYVGVVYEFPSYGIKDIRFNRYGNNSCDFDNEGERVVLFNGKKVWPQKSCYFYVSHASGGLIDCISEKSSPWYLWEDKQFCITFQYQAHSIICSLLLVDNGEFSSYEIFHYVPDCG